MVTITDQPEHEYGLPSFAEFLLSRSAVRKAAARDLQTIRARKNSDVERLRQSYEHQISELRSSGVSPAAWARLRAELQLQRGKDLKAVRSSHDVEIKEIRRRYGIESSPAKQAATDFRDFMHAATVHREDAELAARNGLPNPGFDPVLMQLPQARRRREDGWLVYETPELHGLVGQRELLRCNQREIVVRGADDDRVRAALLVASERYSPPLHIAGSDKFIARARAIADELGIELAAAATQQKTNSTPAESPSPAGAQNASDAASADESTPDVVRPTQLNKDPELDFTVDPSVLKQHASDFGKAFVVPATSDKIQGTVLAFFADAWNHSAALLIACNERAAVLVPVDQDLDPAVNTGAMLELTRTENGRYDVRCLEQTITPEEPEPTPEIEVEREPDGLQEVSVARGGGRKH